MTLAESLLVWSAGLIAVATLGVGAVTLATAALTRTRQQNADEVRERVRPALLERLFRSDPDWADWVGTLSESERIQLRALLEELLRKLRGTEHRRLRALGRALGIPEAARRNLAAGRRRTRALTWLALLAEPVDPDRLVACCSDDPRLRAGAARVLYATDHTDAARLGTEMLVAGESVSAFGLDTLYRLNAGTQTPLLSRMAAGVAEWEDGLLVQALIVLRYCAIDAPADRLDWLPAALDHDSPQVRSAAVGVLERHGWREQFRASYDVDALLEDSHQSVRQDTYLTLASWGTAWSAARLRDAIETAPDGDRLAVARAALAHDRIDVADLGPRYRPFVEWVLADEAAGRPRRMWGVSPAWD